MPPPGIVYERASVRNELRERVARAEQEALIGRPALERAVRELLGKNCDQDTLYCGLVFLAGLTLNVNRSAPIASHLGEPVDKVRPFVQRAFRCGVFADENGVVTWDRDLFRRRPKGIQPVAVMLHIMAIMGITTISRGGKPVQGERPEDEA